MLSDQKLEELGFISRNKTVYKSKVRIFFKEILRYGNEALRITIKVNTVANVNDSFASIEVLDTKRRKWREIDYIPRLVMKTLYLNGEISSENLIQQDRDTLVELAHAILSVNI